MNLADVEGEFAVIMGDPPWRFTTYAKKGGVPQRAAVQHYETMSREELVALAAEIDRLAAKDCVLVLWTTSANLAECLALGAAWGFTYKSLAFVWVKTLKSEDTRQMGFFAPVPGYRMSLGHWTRQQSEIALLFTRGKPKRVSKGVRQVVAEPIREHSRKPDTVADRIRALCNGPYLELFGRNPRPGWTVAGNETTKYEGPQE